MSNLRQLLTTAIVGSARAATQIVQEARQVANSVSAVPSPRVSTVPVTAMGAPAGPTLADAANQLINKTPAIIAAAQHLASKTVQVLRTPAGQRAAGMLVQLALATAARAVVRTAFGPIAGNVAASVIGVAAGVREVKSATSTSTANATTS